MKRQGASSERKRARIPSGKAGAEGGGVGRWPTVPRGAGRAGSGRAGVLARGLIAISLEVLSPAPHKHPTVRRNLLLGFKHVKSEGLMARVARLWSQIGV